MFTMIDPFDYTALQKLEDLLDLHCGCAVRPSPHCPVHNAKLFIEAVEKKLAGAEAEKAAQEAEMDKTLEVENAEAAKEAAKEAHAAWAPVADLVYQLHQDLDLPEPRGEVEPGAVLAALEAVVEVGSPKEVLEQVQEELHDAVQACERARQKVAALQKGGKKA